MTSQPSSPTLRLLLGIRARIGRSGTSSGVLDRLLAALVRRSEGVHSRRLLASLNDRMLRDIGIERDKIESDGIDWSWRLR